MPITPTFNNRFKEERRLWMYNETGKMRVQFCYMEIEDANQPGLMAQTAFPVSILATGQNPYYIKWRGVWINDGTQTFKIRKMAFCGSTSVREITDVSEVLPIYGLGQQDQIELWHYEWQAGQEPQIEPDQSLVVNYTLNFA
jgi:hypothetical protein